MAKWWDRWWRTFATGLSFFVFGAAGLVLGAVVFPVVKLLVRDVTIRSRRSRGIIAWTFRRFVGMMRGLGLLTYELRHFERLDRQGLLVLANHPSLIDTVFLLGFVRNSTCVVDSVLFRNRFTGGPLRAAGYIENTEGVEVLSRCAEALDALTNVIIFPEGTRTPVSGTVKLRRGASHIAVRSRRNVTPVIIRCQPRTLMKGEMWWEIPPRPPHFSLEVAGDILVRAFGDPDHDAAMAVRRLSAHLEQLFTAETPPNAGS